MAAMGEDVQEPTIGIFKYTYTLMRNLPKKMIEIFFRFSALIFWLMELQQID